MYLIWVMWRLNLEYQRLKLLIMISFYQSYQIVCILQHTPITLPTLHIDMAIKLATKKELENLNKQWKRSLIATKLTIQLVNQEDTQIVSKIDSVVKIARDTTIIPFGTAEVRGVIKTPNHYKCINVVIDDLPENQHCKDIAIVQQIQVLKPGSNKIPVVLQNLSCRTLKIRKGMKIAHVEASKVIPSFVSSQVSENILKKCTLPKYLDT